jgi:hypothetical protein
MKAIGVTVLFPGLAMAGYKNARYSGRVFAKKYIGTPTRMSWRSKPSALAFYSGSQWRFFNIE